MARSFNVGVLLMMAMVLSAAEPLAVVTGNTVCQDLVVRIGGERVSSTCLLRPGMDVHAYQPVPADVQRLAAARLVVINGLGFEGWFEKLAREADFRGTVVVATAGIEPLPLPTRETGDHHDHDHGHEGAVDDPHAFNSIARGVRYAENIRDALLAADPAGAEGIRRRAADEIARLRELDAWATREAAALPKARRRLVTNHDALQYFAHDYGFSIIAPNTALEDSQPSAQDLAAIVDTIRREGVRGIFLEFGKNDKVVEQIAREAGVRVGQPLYLDGTGPDGSYAAMFRHNVTAILDAIR